MKTAFDSSGASLVEVPELVRQSYISDILSIKPLDEMEERDIKLALEWLQTEKNINKPHNLVAHLGVLGVLLSSDRLQTFLLKHRKSGLWLPPGGHVDLGHTFKESAISELKEELGVNEPKLIVELPFFLNRTLTQGLNAGHTDITVWMLLAGDRHDEYEIQEKEATEGRWVAVEDVLNDVTMSHLHRGFKKI